MRLLIVYSLLPVLVLPALRGQDVNLALQPAATATQSSTAYSGDASRAIDGSRDGFWPHNSVTMTQDAPGSWWQVAFPVDTVNEVRLYNRSDACWLRLANFRVEVSFRGFVLLSRDFFTAGGSVGHGDCCDFELPTGGVPADLVRISLLGPGPTGEQILSLAEVEVVQYGPQPEVNLAPLGTASLTNAAFGSTGSEANDGEFDGVFANGSVTSTLDMAGSQWTVQLPFRSRIDVIRIWNRTDSCPERLSNFRVSVFDGAVETFRSDLYVSGGHAPVSTPEVVTMPLITRGDSVRIALLGPGRTGEQVLSLAEVEVIRYGMPPRYQPFGSGCQGSSGTPTLRCQGQSAPTLGSTFTLEVTNLPSGRGAVALLFGFSSTMLGNQALPMDLASFGAPGCQLLTSADGLQWLVHSSSNLTASFAVPDSRVLLGTTFYHQAMVIDRPANALGATFTNGAQLIIGM